MIVSHNQFSERKRLALPAILICCSLCLFLLFNFFTNGDAVKTVLFPDINDNYMDFFNSLTDASSSNPYVKLHVIYPPLCYDLFRIFGAMIPSEYYAEGSGFIIRSTLEGMLSFYIYLLISLGCLFYFTYKYMRKKHIDCGCLFLIGLFLSAPVLYAIQRGNTIIFAVGCVEAFLCYKDENSFLKRQFALFMLAFAANIKIYPAIFGLLLVSERKWRDCLWCIAYGVLLFLIPMSHFGGLDNIPVLIKNIQDTTNSFEMTLGARVDFGWLMSFMSANGFARGFLEALQGKNLVFGAAILLFCLFFCRDEGDRIMCLAFVCTFIPGFSYMYNLLYLIPLFFILVKKRNPLLFIILMLPFLYYPFDISSSAMMNIKDAILIPRLWDFISTLSGVCLLVGILYDVIVSHEQIRFRGKNESLIIFNHE